MIKIYKDDMEAIADDTQVALMVEAGWSTEAPVKKEKEADVKTPAPVKRKIGGE